MKNLYDIMDDKEKQEVEDINAFWSYIALTINL